MRGKILVIAGSDSGGGAGIQADIKTISALGGYPTTAITAITAQNTIAINDIHYLPNDIIASQIEAVFSDIKIDAVKIGMLGNDNIVNQVAKSLKKFATDVPIILDSVMIAKTGNSLLAEESLEGFKMNLLPLASLVTPNLPELEVLSDIKIKTKDNIVKAARKIIDFGAEAVLVKGGHGKGEILYDILVTENNVKIFQGERINTKNTHGTGCTLASAIATYITQGNSLEISVMKARKYVRSAIIKSFSIGHGHGCLQHF